MELVLYLTSLAIALFGFKLFKFKKTLLAFFMWVFTIFIVIPSYYSYKSLFFGSDFTFYFVSILIFQVIILSTLYIQEKKKLSRELLLINAGEVFSNSLLQRVVEIVVVLFCILYLYIGTSTLGGLPWLLWIQGDFAVQYRIELWVNTLGSIPGSSAIRFFAKFGALFLSIHYFNVSKKSRGVIFFFLALLTFTIEGTKASFVLLMLPIVIYTFLYNKQFFKRWMPLLIILITAGTVWLALTESEGNLQVAVQEKVIERVLVVPSKVSAIHFYINEDNMLLGKTNALVNNISNEKLDLNNARDYDNYVMRWYRVNILNIAPGSSGSLNAPGFIYGWVDFGLIGIILLALLSSLLLLVLDFLITKGEISPALIALLPVFIIRFTTSDAYWNVFWGMEGVLMLLFLNLVFIRKKLQAHILYWLILFYGTVYNGSLFISRIFN